MNTPYRGTPQPTRSSGPRPELEKIRTIDIRFGETIADTLYANIAEEKAQFLADNPGDRNKYTQLRRFYDELCLWNEKVNSRGTPQEKQVRYAKFAPLIKMLNAKVVYAEGRKHVDSNFVALFREVISQIKDHQTLEQGKLFMEAFMGFYKATKKG